VISWWWWWCGGVMVVWWWCGVVMWWYTNQVLGGCTPETPCNPRRLEFDLFLQLWCFRCRISVFSILCASGAEFVIFSNFGCLRRRIRHMLVVCLYFAIIRRRLVSYEVLPLLHISRITWELRCLNESFVAHHQPEL
jgi:hypothetical protein